MSDMVLKYKGVQGTYHYNKELKMFVGEIRKVNGIVTFRGRTLKEVKKSFQNTVDGVVLR